MNAISSFFKDRRIQSDNNKEILHNIRGMFKNKLLLTSDRLKTILGIMLHNYNSFYEDIDPKPININI
ncbi:MAG: hypothetical protein ORN26_00880 [Candidatus Pacebacteria bacterium]|nr:hypothetical protein [Candidatus Paceibacterota bacterium]